MFSAKLLSLGESYMKHNKHTQSTTQRTPASSHLKSKLRRAERIARRFEEHGFAEEIVQQAREEVRRLKMENRNNDD